METIREKGLHWLNIVGPILFVLAIAAVTTRSQVYRSVPGEIVDSTHDINQGYRDFHNAIYFPVRAMLTGVNPYSAEYLEFHPDELGFPQYSPSSLLLHSFVGFFNVKSAEIVYLIVNLVLLLLIGWLALKKTDQWFPIGAVFLLCAVIVLCRPGLLNFLGLQMTLLLILGTYLALEYSDKSPAISGVGLLLAFCKPTWGIPLGIMMLFRRNLSAVSLGGVLILVFNAVAVWIIASQTGGLQEFATQVQSQYGSSLSDAVEIPKVIDSWARVDIYSMIVRWYQEVDSELLVFGSVLLLGVIVMLLERSPAHRHGINSRTGLFAILVMLISIYHQPYDTLVLWIPLVALVGGALNFRSSFGSVTKWALVLLMLVPMLNFLGTKFVLEGGLAERLPQLAEYLDFSKTAAMTPEGLELKDQLLYAWPWKLAVTINGIALTLAALIVGFRIVASRFIPIAYDEEGDW